MFLSSRLAAVTFAALAATGAHGLRHAEPIHVENAQQATSFTMEDDGGILTPNGTKVPPFFGLKVISKLPDDAFVCYNGRVFGVRLPGRDGGATIFSYVRLNPIARVWPLQVYVDIGDPRKQFLLFPPVEKISDHWRLIYRVAAELTDFTAWLDERLFEVSKEHPCGPEGDWEAKAAAKKAAQEQRELDAANRVRMARTLASGQIPGVEKAYAHRTPATAATDDDDDDEAEADEAGAGIADVNDEGDDAEDADADAVHADDVEDDGLNADSDDADVDYADADDADADDAGIGADELGDDDEDEAQGGAVVEEEGLPEAELGPALGEEDAEVESSDEEDEEDDDASSETSSEASEGSVEDEDVGLLRRTATRLWGLVSLPFASSSARVDSDSDSEPEYIY